MTYMVGGGEGAVGSPDLAAGDLEALECLLRGESVGGHLGVVWRVGWASTHW